MSMVFCKSCGNSIELEDDEADEWPLRCDDCVSNKVPLPAGYEDLIGGKHDNN